MILSLLYVITKYTVVESIAPNAAPVSPPTINFPAIAPVATLDFNAEPVQVSTETTLLNLTDIS